jgi:hypothetical protein
MPFPTSHAGRGKTATVDAYRIMPNPGNVQNLVSGNVLWATGMPFINRILQQWKLSGFTIDIDNHYQLN